MGDSMSLVIRDKALIAEIKRRAEGRIIAFLWRLLRGDEAFDYAALDPGIRDAVRLLRDAGFETTDSGDGRTKPAMARTFDWPHVVVRLRAGQTVADIERIGRLLVGWQLEVSVAPDEPTLLIVSDPPVRS